MIPDQLKKLEKEGGWTHNYLFLLSWTLTGTLGKLDIEVMANEANSWLPQTLANIKIGKLKKPNIVYIDFIDAYMGRAILDVNLSVQLGN